MTATPTTRPSSAERALVGALVRRACWPSSSASALIGAGRRAASRPSARPRCWCSRRWSARACARSAPRPTAAGRADAARALRARPPRGRCSTSSSRTCRRVLGGKPLEHDWPKLATALAALWPAVWLAAACRSRSSRWPTRRWRARPGSRSAASATRCYSGLGLACALVFAFSLAYVASERDKKVDLAYFRTTRPGEATRKIVRKLDQPIEVALFFPAGERGARGGRRLLPRSGEGVDPAQGHPLRPRHRSAKAKEYGVSGNGMVVFARGRRQEQLGLPSELEARSTPLRTLDKEVQKRLLMVVSRPRTVAFTRATASALGEAGQRHRQARRHQDPARRAGRPELRRARPRRGRGARPTCPRTPPSSW